MWKKRDVVPTPARSTYLLSQCMLHTTSFAFQRRLAASHLMAADMSRMMERGVMLLNWPEQSHSPRDVHPQSLRPCTQGWRSHIRKTKNEAVISSTSRRKKSVKACAALRK